MCNDRAMKDLGLFPGAPKVVCGLIVRSELENIFKFKGVGSRPPKSEHFTT